VARRVYSEINLHITWHTHGNTPVLTELIEAQLHRYLRRRARESEGVVVHEINGMPDHIHLAVTVPPTLNIAEWIGQIKGASAHFINHQIGNKKILAWQSGYGVVSFGTRDLPWVTAYIRNQKRHHAEGSVHERLERIECHHETSSANHAGPNKPVETGWEGGEGQ
jgi:putative transposase